MHMSGAWTLAALSWLAAIAPTEPCRLELLTDEDVLESIERIVSVVPRGQSTYIPWTTGPWPAHLDGINHRWQSPDTQLSPAEKYATAFGLDVQDFTNQMSKISGVDSSNQTCAHSSDCEDNQVCGKRRGMTTGRCHARSASLQDSWALAAVEVEEPKCAVEKNGVMFHPQDIKALVTQLYFQSERIYIAMFGRQPREVTRFGADYSIHCDRTYENVVYERWYCGNINSHEFFGTLTHVVGKMRQPLLIRFAGIAGYFPIVGYRVQEMKSSPIVSIDKNRRVTMNSIRLELDWMLSVLDSEEDFTTMRSAVSFISTDNWAVLKFTGVGDTTALLPVSLEIPVPSILQEDESTKLTIQNVMALVSASTNCPTPTPLGTTKMCSSVPYNLELRRLQKQVERCEAATQFSFSGSQQPVLSRLCVNADCREVLDALRRIEYRGCVLPTGLDIVRVLDQFYSACVGVEYARPLDNTTNARSLAPVGAIEPSLNRPTPVPRVRTTSPTKLPFKPKLLDGSSDQSGVVVSHFTTVFDFFGINSTSSIPSASPSVPDGSPANMQTSSHRPTQQSTQQQPTQNTAGDEDTAMRPTSTWTSVVSGSNASLIPRQHLKPIVDAHTASPSTAPTPPVVITRPSLQSGSLPSFLIQLAIVGTFILLGEIVLLCYRWRQSGDTRKRRRPGRDIAPPILSLWGEQALMNRYIPPAAIKIVRLLDRGSSGVVYLVRLNDRQLAASKRLATHHVNDLTAQQQLIDEIKLNASLEHPNIVALIGASWITRANLQAVFEYLSGGDLLSYLESNRTPERMMWTRAKLQLAMDVAYALAYIHSLLPSPVVHRDLKSRNILLSPSSSSSSSSSSGKLTAKLGDFGAARLQSLNDGDATRADIGTSRWLAPEVILGGRQHSSASDMYSFGVVLTELDTHQVPFSDVQGPEATQLPDATILWMVAHERLQPSISPSCPEPLAALARACLAFEPTERPTASQVCKILQAMQMTAS